MLSTAEFTELISLIQTTFDDEGPKPEVRRAPRIAHPCQCTITLGLTESAGPSHLVQLKDLSTRGACFLHCRQVENGSTVMVRLQAPDGQWATVLSKIVHCRKIDEQTFEIGAEFVHSAPAHDAKPRHYDPEDFMTIRTHAHPPSRA